MKIYIIRHGETLANSKQIMQGTIDTPLTEMGAKLAKITADGLKDIKFDKIYSSPLKRAYDTATYIAKANHYPLDKIIIDDSIKEIDMGSWEGKTLQEIIQDMSKDELESFFTNPLKLGHVGGGESALEVCKRTQAFLHKIASNDDSNILIATHGFAVRAMLNFLYENKDDFWQGHVPYNCAVNILEYKDNKFNFIAKDKIYYDDSLLVDRYEIK